jgi:RHS repeat-associated protein
MDLPAGVPASTYTYAGMGYANPHAVTQIANGFSTSTFTYDNNGNLLQKTVDGTSTTYVWDYANRLTALGVGGTGTTTYGYDAFGARVYQIASSTATTTYPFKFFSVASSTRSGSQAFRNGATTGAPQTRYIHPDHLGSTNIVTNASGTVVQTLDYYPYGATRVSDSVGGANSARKYIGQFADQSNLDYLNARYYESARGQFISQDPVFWEIGVSQDGKNALSNPQALNSYGYANDNPITGKDPNGRQCVACAGAEVLYSLGAQTAYDGAFGQSSRAVYGGDIVGASLYGFAYPWTLVAPVPVAAGAGGAGNAAQQGFEYLSGDRTSFDASQVRSSAMVAGATQLGLGFLPIPFTSALTKQITTKLEKGIISRVSNNTMTKIAASNAPGSFVGNFATNYAQTQFNNLNLGSTRNYASALSMALPGSSLSTTISIAQAAIQLAQSVIASYKTQPSR